MKKIILVISLWFVNVYAFDSGTYECTMHFKTMPSVDNTFILKSNKRAKLIAPMGITRGTWFDNDDEAIMDWGNF